MLFTGDTAVVDDDSVVWLSPSDGLWYVDVSLRWKSKRPEWVAVWNG